jgi:4'-phosphopantetheinyl transferase
MDVYWLEQTEADVPQQENWLSANEAAILSTMRFPKRRADWLLGRWTAKNAFAICFGHPTEPRALQEIEIRAAPSGAPDIFFRNEPSTATISLSHRAGLGACAVAPSHVLLGCDVEIIEPRGDAFATDYFTLEEQAAFAKTGMADRLRLLALFWSSKESALKALREGLRLDTRSMIVSLPARSSSTPNRWSPLQVRSLNNQILHGWWSQSGSLLRTVLAAPPPDAPILLAREHCVA